VAAVLSRGGGADVADVVSRGGGADVPDVLSRRGEADVADAVSRAKVVLGVLSQAGRGLLLAAAAAKLVAVSGKADVVPCARGVLCLIPPVAGGVLPAAAAVESVLGAQGAALLPRNTTRTRRSAEMVAVSMSRKVAFPSCAC